MDRRMLRETFERQLKAGLWQYAVMGGKQRAVQPTNLKADYAAGLYGADSGYSLSILTVILDGLPGKGDTVTMDGKSYIVLGREDFGGISCRFDLREGV